MTTLATGSEGRFLSVYRGQLSALNQVPLAFKKPAFHFSSQIGCSTSPHTAAPRGPYPRCLPRLPDHTSTYRHTSSLNRDSQRHDCNRAANEMGAQRRTTHYGSRPTSAEASSGLPDSWGALLKSTPAHSPWAAPGYTRISRGKGRRAALQGTPRVTAMACSWPSIWNRPLCQNRQILPTGSQAGGWRPHDIITAPS